MTLEEILLSDDVVDSINKNRDYLLEIIPEIKNMIGFEHNHPHHHLDVWNHTLLALSMSKNDFDIRLCLLLHDMGKPFSYQDEEVRHFKDHAKVSANMSKSILNRLGYPKEYTDYICSLISMHDTSFIDADINSNYDYYLKLYEIQRCDALAHHPDKLDKRKEYLNEIQKLLKNK